VLHCLHRARLEGIDEVRMADLVGRLLVRPPSVTTVVQRLTQLGLIVGQRSSIDQRAKCIALTPAGCRLVARVLGRRDEQIEQMFRCLSERQRSQLTELLEQFTTHLSGLVKSEA
jgi:DNA-binding MarR family transcriptional regulator